ncbi:MAG: hypothetical protein LN415_09135 [Candidatus Thermoplasmatota archaeon]|nr:hypothetical protein [Candidatus Thermoplasmatota archaeon]
MRTKKLPMRAILCLGQVPGQPRLREDRLFLPVVVGTAVVLAVLFLILAALLAGLMFRETGQYRGVWFSNPEQMSATEWKVTVTVVNGPAESHGWEAILLENGTIVEELDPITDEPSTHLTFVDLAGHGKLSAGDYFLVECDPSRSYELVMVWRDSGSVYGSEAWET